MTTFSIRSVLGRTSTIIGQSIGSVGLLIIGAQLVIAAAQLALVRPLMASAMAGQSSPFTLFSSPIYWTVMIATFAIFGTLLAATVHGFLVTARGERAQIADCVRDGVSKALPVLGLSILYFLGVWVGMILLLVPGFILMAMWSAALPALIAGDAGVLGSFGRSRELTKGSRLKIFALILLLIVVYYVLYIALLGSVMAGIASNSASGNLAASMAAATGPAVLVGSMVVNTIMLFVFPAMVTSIYVETNRGNLGLRGETVEDVFA